MTTEEIKELKQKIKDISEPGEIEKHFKFETPYKRLEKTVGEYKDNTALMYFGNKLTYEEMLNEVDLLAKGLAGCGIGKDDVVTVSLLATPYSIIMFYALMKIGAVVHLVNCSASLEEIKRELSNFDTKYFIANDLFCSKDMRKMVFNLGIEKIIAISTLDGMPRGFNQFKFKYTIIEKIKGLRKKDFDGEKVISLSQLKKIGIANQEDVEACGFEADRMTAIAYTSGSTGESKAVVATYESMDSMVYMIGLTEEEIEIGDVAFTTFPLWIYYSLVNMIHEMLNNGVAIAVDPLFDAKKFAAINNMYKFHHWQTIPPYVKQIVDEGKKTDCSHWKRIITGGDVLDESLSERTNEYISKNGGNIKIGSGYGASELMGGFAYPYYKNCSKHCVGKPMVGAFVKVLDVDTGEELGVNETGVGYVHAPTIMKEYYGNPEATSHNLIKDERGVMWYNTEDLIHFNEKGEIFIDGRIRRIVLTLDKEGNPTKIIPDRVKKELQSQLLVDKCEIITVPDEEKENVAIACVIIKECNESEELKGELIEYCSQKVPEYMVPVDVMFVKEIPLTAAQKPDLKALESMWQANSKR